MPGRCWKHRQGSGCRLGERATASRPAPVLTKINGDGSRSRPPPTAHRWSRRQRGERGEQVAIGKRRAVLAAKAERPVSGSRAVVCLVRLLGSITD